MILFTSQNSEYLMLNVNSDHISCHQDCDRGNIMELSVDEKEGQSSHKGVYENSACPEL